MILPNPRSLSPVKFARSAIASATSQNVIALFMAALVITTGIFLYRFGVNLPVHDEWDLTCEFFSVGLWEWIPLRHNEHRFWLGRTIWGTGMMLSGWDFRVGGWITLTMLSLAAVWLVRTAKFVRGRCLLADLFVPAVLLNAGHAFNLVMGYQIVFAATAVCGCGLLATALKSGTASTFRTGIAANLWLVLMSGNGGFGIGFAPAIAAWIAFIAWRRMREGHRRDAMLLLLGPVLVLAYTGWSFMNQPASAAPPHQATLESAIGGAIGYFTAGIGSVMTNHSLAISGWVPVIAAAVVAVYLVAVVRLARVIVAMPEERVRAFGLLCVLGGQAAVALGIGLTREGGIADRYATPSAIGLLACWATGICYGPRTPRGRFVDLAVCVVAGVAIAVANAMPSPHYSIAALMRNPLVQMNRDLKAGMPASFLAGKYGQSFGVLVGDRIGIYLLQFRDAGIRPFRELVNDPAMTPVLVDDVAFPCHIPTKPSDHFLATPAPNAMALAAPQGHVYGLRFEFIQDVVDGYQVFVLHWRDAGGLDRRAEAYGPFFLARGTIAFWVNGPATHVRLERQGTGNGPTITSAAWLVPPR